MTSPLPTSWNELPVFPIERFHIDPSAHPEELPRVFPMWDYQLGRRVACKYSVDPALIGDFSTEDLDELATAGYQPQRLLLLARINRRYDLLREARMMAMVDHPNVLSILEIGRFENNIIVMLLPYLDGGTLADRDFSGPWENVLDTALQLGRGIEALHAAGILHRDLKPENVLFDRAGRPRVADLELSCHMDDISGLSHCVGTPAYMPPGVEGKGFEDVRDDLYVYCLMAFEMFYGRSAFDSQVDRELGKVAKVERKGGMPRELHDIIVRGLAPDRNDRWANMGVLLQRMEGVRRPAAKRRWVWGSTAAALAIGIGIGNLTDERTAEADACSDIMEELGPIWNEGVQGELRGAFGTRKAGDGLTAWANRWLVVRAGECSVARRDDTSLDASPCLASTRDRFQATLYAFRTPHLKAGLRYASVIADLPAPEHCIDHPDDADWGYGGLLELRDLDVEVDALVRLGDLETALGRQADYMNLALDLGSTHGAARAAYFRAEIHRLEGKVDEAAEEFLLALNEAVSIEAHLFTAECLMKLAAVSGDRGQLEAVDAYAAMASGFFDRYQPDRIAELLQVQGLALVNGPEHVRARGVGLLLRAVEMREDQFDLYGGTRELLSQAHEIYAKGLLAVGRASEAIEYLELALHVHQDEFGHGTWRTRGILREKFSALLALGRIDDAKSVWRSVLQSSENQQNWSRFFEDARWLADEYVRAGRPDAAMWPLSMGRDMARKRDQADVAAQFEEQIVILSAM